MDNQIYSFFFMAGKGMILIIVLLVAVYLYIQVKEVFKKKGPKP